MPAVAPPVAQIARRPSNFPWILLNDMLGEDNGAYAVGGTVVIVTAAAALLIGDAVYLSAAFTVNKSAAGGNQVFRVGIVVGGVPRSMESSTLEVIQRLGDIGLAAAAANDPVLVCQSGLCYAVADGAITVGSQVKPSTGTAGRVTQATPTTDAGKIVGMAWDGAGGAGDKIRVMVDLS